MHIPLSGWMSCEAGEKKKAWTGNKRRRDSRAIKSRLKKDRRVESPELCPSLLSGGPPAPSLPATEDITDPLCPLPASAASNSPELCLPSCVSTLPRRKSPYKYDDRLGCCNVPLTMLVGIVSRPPMPDVLFVSGKRGTTVLVFLRFPFVKCRRLFRRVTHTS